VSESAPRIARQRRAGPSPEHPLMTVNQAAAVLGCSSMTIRRRIDARQFPAVKIGCKALVPRAFVDALLRAASAGETVVVEEFVRTWSLTGPGGAA
jgi:excisionase family DNA binding protein